MLFITLIIILVLADLIYAIRQERIQSNTLCSKRHLHKLCSFKMFQIVRFHIAKK